MFRPLMRRSITLGVLIAFVAVALPSHADDEGKGFYKRKDRSRSESTTDTSKKDHWWKFWGKDKEAEDSQALEYGWKGWNAKRGEATTSRETFTTKVKKHRKPGESTPRNRTVSKKKGTPRQAQHDAGWTHRVDKKYNPERFQHKDGKFRLEKDKKKKSDPRARLNWEKPRPRDTNEKAGQSHKNGNFRRNDR